MGYVLCIQMDITAYLYVKILISKDAVVVKNCKDRKWKLYTVVLNDGSFGQ